MLLRRECAVISVYKAAVINLLHIVQARTYVANRHNLQAPQAAIPVPGLTGADIVLMVPQDCWFDAGFPQMLAELAGL